MNYTLKIKVNDRYEEVDLDKSFQVNFNYQIKDFEKPGDIKSAFSKTINIIGTPKNNTLFSNIYKLGSVYVSIDPNKRIDYILTYNALVVSTGYLVINSIDKSTRNIKYKCTLYDLLTKTLYDIKYNEDGSIRTLDTLDFGLYDENETYNYGMKYTLDSWSQFGGTDDGSGDALTHIRLAVQNPYVEYEYWKGPDNINNSIMSLLVPINCHLGYYDEFNSKKFLYHHPANEDPYILEFDPKIESGNIGYYSNKLVLNKGDEVRRVNNNIVYGPYKDWSLYEAERDIHPSEAKEILANRLPLGLELGKTWDTICNTFKIDDTEVHSKLHNYIDKTYLTLPALSKIYGPGNIESKNSYNTRKSGVKETIINNNYERGQINFFNSDNLLKFSEETSYNKTVDESASTIAVEISPEIDSTSRLETNLFWGKYNISHSPVSIIWGGRKYSELKGYSTQNIPYNNLYDNIIIKPFIIYKISITQNNNTRYKYVILGGDYGYSEYGEQESTTNARALECAKIVLTNNGINKNDIIIDYHKSKFYFNSKSNTYKPYENITVFFDNLGGVANIKVNSDAITVFIPDVEYNDPVHDWSNPWDSIYNYWNQNLGAIRRPNIITSINGVYTTLEAEFLYDNNTIFNRYNTGSLDTTNSTYINFSGKGRGECNVYAKNKTWFISTLTHPMVLNGFFMLYHTYAGDTFLNTYLQNTKASYNVSFLNVLGSKDSVKIDISKSIILKDVSVLDTMLGICKTYNINLISNNSNLKAVFNENMFNNKVVDLTDDIDTSSISISPTIIKSQCYEYKLDNPETYSNYISEKANPGYNITKQFYNNNINSTPIEILENVDYKTTMPYRFTSVYNARPVHYDTHYSTPTKGNTYKHTLFAETSNGIEQNTVEAPGLYRQNPILSENEEETHGIELLSFFDNSMKTIDFSNMLVCFERNYISKYPIVVTEDIPITKQIAGEYCFFYIPRRSKIIEKVNYDIPYSITKNVKDFYTEIMQYPKFSTVKLVKDKQKYVYMNYAFDTKSLEYPLIYDSFFADTREPYNYLYEEANYFNRTRPRVNLYDTFFDNYNQLIYNTNYKQIKCKVRLHSYNIEEILRNVYFYDNAYFVINKLNNFDFSKEFNEVELVQVNYQKLQELNGGV